MFEKMQRCLIFLEIHRSAKSSRVSHSHHSPNSNRYLDNDGSIVISQNLCIASSNIDDIFPEVDPTRTLDARQILWPHIIFKLIKAILVNRMKITKLHLLISSDFHSDIDFRGSKCKYDDDDDDEEVRITRKLARILKQFSIKEIWIAAFCVWKNIKIYYDSLNKEFGSSTDMHVAKIGKLCSKYLWEYILNYELIFFQRYYTIIFPAHVWALLDTQLFMNHIYMIIFQYVSINSMNSKGSISNIFCAQFISDKCYSFVCHFQYYCIYDQIRCNDSHVAVYCSLNSNKISVNDCGNDYCQDKNNNPNFVLIE